MIVEFDNGLTRSQLYCVYYSRSIVHVLLSSIIRQTDKLIIAQIRRGNNFTCDCVDFMKTRVYNRHDRHSPLLQSYLDIFFVHSERTLLGGCRIYVSVNWNKDTNRLQ